MASNSGSAATITGNPQNMLIGSFSGLYAAFARCLAPAAIAGMAITALVIWLFYCGEFDGGQPVRIARRPVRIHAALLWKSLIAAAVMIGMFFAGWPVPKVAILAGAALLITRRVKPERVYQRIDWSLLVLFAGLFIVIAGVERTSLEADLKLLAARAGLDNVFVLSGLSAVLSNLVSNVPAVLVFKPFMAHLHIQRGPGLRWRCRRRSRGISRCLAPSQI